MLRAGDLPPGFVAFDEGELEPTDDTSVGALGDAGGPRRVAGWKARYRRADAGARRGPLVVESIVELFGDEGDATAHFAALRKQLGRPIDGAEPGEERAAPGVGDAATVATYLQRARPSDVRFFVVAWHRDNVTATLTVQGFDRALERDDALALARAQDRAMSAAAR